VGPPGRSIAARDDMLDVAPALASPSGVSPLVVLYVSRH
jgi:hypothetical protein